MKRFLKKCQIAVLATSMFFGISAFGACAKPVIPPIDNDDDYQQTIDPEDKDKPTTPQETPEKPPVDTNKEKLEQNAGKLLAIVGEAQKAMNFHYREDESDLYVQMTSEDFKFKYSVGNNDTYYAGTKAESGAEHQYDVYKIYKDSKGNWVGEPTDEEGPAVGNPFFLLGVDWTAYDGGRLIGKSGSDNVSATFDEDLMKVNWSVNGQSRLLDQIEGVNLTLPTYTDLSKPAEEYIYKTENGQRKYNIPVLVNALEETLWADNSIFVKNANAGLPATFLRVTHVKKNNEGLFFGAYYKNGRSETPTYCLLGLDEALFTGNEMTSGDFANMIKSKNVFKPYSGEAGIAMSCETSTEENDSLFETKANNALRIYAQKGAQGSSINNSENPIPSLDGADILFACKSITGSSVSGYDMGITVSARYVMVVETKYDEVQELTLKVVMARNYDNFEQYLVDGRSDKVMIATASAEQIDAQNSQLYSETSTVSLNQGIVYAYNKGKEYDY